MNLTICHLYPDLLNSYGDIGNIEVLKYRTSLRNVDVTVVNHLIGDSLDINNYDIIFFGGGQDYEESIAAKDLKGSKRDLLKEYIESNKCFISVCGGYQLLGDYYTTPNDEKLPGLEILPLYTDGGKVRFTGDIVIKNDEYDEIYVGFENHAGRTYLYGDNISPLGKVIEGFGNNGIDLTEGCIYKNTIGTYMHGPLLTKNYEIADRMIKTALAMKYKDIEFKDTPNYFEKMAKDYIIEKYKNLPPKERKELNTYRKKALKS
ncbi:MAG: glutamine amidotransferase [Oscillospiraceae bacterium]|nr:glutamine amidotransferase [Oscillospiraceae bacterium]